MPETERKTVIQRTTSDSPPLGTPDVKKTAVKVMPTGVDEQKEMQALGTPVAQKEK